MTDQHKLKNAIIDRAVLVDRYMHEDLDAIRGKVDDLLLEVLDYGLFNGGKRIRPLLVVLSSRLCGSNDQRVYQLATAFEYLHAATLFHDDVIDGAMSRRGKPAVNIKFGLIAAILAGDYLHARSMHIVGNIAGKEGLAIFCMATAGMVDGEFMQLRNSDSFSTSESGYYETIMGKTGLLIAAACRVGALYGGGNPEQQERLHQYGVGLGCAFQMIDDLLDYTGDEQKTGKAVGNDLIEGKMTLPLILGWEQADSTDRACLEQILSDESLRKSEFSTVYGILDKYGAFTETRARARQHVTEALLQLETFSAPEGFEAKEILTGLAGYVLEREK
ncbi:polyprenyl synthetase family protein [Desulfopila sp. IMCC35008]|uniref:polyprenyl synthetase family protein n=1 Tax=Desulfopila sp. IMCC35008 TaxID=2653858 RepID=UPI0013D2706E|nr:polyprenyl synthetase family protein [Desulfopila sp. IMCC35008]